MPANKKHLDPSFHQRFAKITAGFIGGFMITITLFLVPAILTDPVIVLFTLKFAGFIVWGTLMIIPFLFKNGWKAWGIYLLAIILLSSLLLLIKIQSPELYSGL
ncbi:hypothetical protein JKA74_03295 [Marivirga sp. S37H4]|uniref:Uncharacterized protein n=1 Tax=Marivirga aurantiaca TaxID=2802615 RepID=A0A934WW68_9BACT|nr:hypothetical protein [Marivirga aurantiaca]MBK6264051.1 hypothetical protein [Marivirga aurantiaca]